MAAEYQVLGRFSLSRVGVNIAAHQSGRLAGNQLPSVGILAHGLVAGGAVDHHHGPRQRVGNAGRTRRPYVFAQLRRQHKPRHRITGKQQMGAHRHLPALPRRLYAGRRTRREMPGLIKLRIIGQKGLGHQPQKPAAADRRRRVVKLSVVFPGQPDKGQQVQFRRVLNQPFQRLLCPVCQQALQKQIAAGIAGQAEFRKHRDLGAPSGRLFHQLLHLRGIVFRIRHPDLRRSRRRPYKSLIHVLFPLHI